MKLWIENEALQGQDKSLLWPGALYGLRRLLDAGYELACNSEKLSNEQIRLIENERIVFEKFEKEKSDGHILKNVKEGTILIQVGEVPVVSSLEWGELTQHFLFPRRTATRKRKTNETDIEISVNIDGTGESYIDTGLKFFDHMLEQISRHGLIDLEIRCDGDLDVDEHHTVEDVAITLGQTLLEACGSNKTGIQRYGFLLAMDESQAEVAIDLSNRPYLVWNAEFEREYVGDFPLEMAEHFFYTLAMNLKATLQIRAEGKNEHHKIEAIFKGFARAFRFAVSRTERTKGIFPSSKGAL